VALAALLLLGGARHTFSAELQASTIAAFNHYVRVTEQRMSNDQQRVWIDALAQAEQRLQVDALRRGSVVIERLTTREGGRDINIPDGIVHHWVGVVHSGHDRGQSARAAPGLQPPRGYFMLRRWPPRG
jgi:hypothetical protein